MTATKTDDREILGWSRGPDGWFEVKQPDVNPELAIQDVAGKLNDLSSHLQRMYWEYQKAVAQLQVLS